MGLCLAHSRQSLHDLASRFGVSAERIRQLEQSAMKKAENFKSNFYFLMNEEGA